MRDTVVLVNIFDVTRTIDKKYGTDVTGRGKAYIERVLATDHKHTWPKRDPKGGCAFCGRTRDEVDQ